jgi:hypothetical protein
MTQTTPTTPPIADESALKQDATEIEMAATDASITVPTVIADQVANRTFLSQENAVGYQQYLEARDLEFSDAEVRPVPRVQPAKEENISKRLTLY